MPTRRLSLPAKLFDPGRGRRGAVLLGALAVVAAGIALGMAFAAPLTPDARLQAGQALYTEYCATCHGDEGRGDGPSAAALATRPTNLTDGQRLNRLPDEFFMNVIRHGGAAEGLAPTMPPFAAFLGVTEARAVVHYVRSLAEPPFDGTQVRPIVTVPGAPPQPIFFSHLIHSSYDIPCQYCHADARRSQYAGLPSVDRCMGCHKITGAADNPEIRKIHEYWNRGEPIPWVRVFKVPEFTYFSHQPHVRAGLECQTCHGPIDQMRVVGGRTGQNVWNDVVNLIGFRPPSPPLTMGWCIECHRLENQTPGRQAPLDCISCHH